MNKSITTLKKVEELKMVFSKATLKATFLIKSSIHLPKNKVLVQFKNLSNAYAWVMLSSKIKPIPS